MYPLDLSLANIWQGWYSFRQDKKASLEIDRFSFNLEKNLFSLYCELNNQKYQHGKYFSFEVHDNKRRNIEVASIIDRVVHRLLYDYLVEIFDKSFIFDVWSCRKGKGLTKAINRSQRFLRSNKLGFVWRSDIKKFFESVDQNILFQLIKRRVNDQKAIWLIDEIISSYQSRLSLSLLIRKAFRLVI